MTFIEAIILAVVEGATEYLPISSTGHLILTSSLLHIPFDEFTNAFTVMVQFGAVLAVAVEYSRFLLQHKNLWPKLFAAFLPAAIIGLALNKMIDRALGSVLVVGLTTLIGGVLLILTDQIFKPSKQRLHSPQSVGFKEALQIGFFQCVALIPGTSRSAATIWGGLFSRMDQKSATEFSFLLAFPTLTAATLYKAYKGYALFTPEHWQLIAVGNVISFLVGWAAIRTFITYVSRHGLKIFGYYRIAIGAVTIAAYYLNWFS